MALLETWWYHFDMICHFTHAGLDFCLKRTYYLQGNTIIIINNVWTLLKSQGLTPCMYKNGRTPYVSKSLRICSFNYPLIYILLCKIISLTNHMWCSYVLVFHFIQNKWYAINVCNWPSESFSVFSWLLVECWFYYWKPQTEQLNLDAIHINVISISVT